MKLGVIGLGKMGAAIALRALKGGDCVLGYDPNNAIGAAMENEGVEIYASPADLAQKADVIWLMVPAGKPVDEVLAQIIPYVKKEVIIIDGGNSKFTDSVRRGKELLLKGIPFLDCGTSGGIHGHANGFCLMVGGDYAAYEKLLPLLKVLAAPGGVGHVGPSGAGHYVKMIHNGIEYGMLQAYAEGFQLLREGDYKDLDLEEITRVWNHGAVIRSWLLELSHDVFKRDQFLANVRGTLQEGGTGQWTADNAHQHKIPVPVIEASLEVRKQSRKTGGNFATKVVAMLRNAFGGHAVEHN